MTKEEAWRLAHEWIESWNAHDLDRIMAHYDDGVELVSPVASQLLGAAGGRITGKANLRAYFQTGLETFPQLNFHLEDVLWGVKSLVICYKNHRGTRTAEFMEFSAAGTVIRVVAHYSA